MQNLVPSPRPVRDFTPVPRKYRYDGWTVERQRGFIAALADTGSVTAACRRINMSIEGAYALRRQPGAEEFAAAWADALDHGVQSLADIAIDRAREGVAVPVYWKGEQVGERRWYNDRLLMFILRHHLPEKYGPLAPLPPGTKHPATLAREAALTRAQAEAAAKAAQDKDDALTEELLRRYKAKIREERRYRLDGDVIAADYTLRQLAHIEMFIVTQGATGKLSDMIAAHHEKNGRYSPDLYAPGISDELAGIRAEVWAQLGDPPRPPIPLPRHTLQSTSPNPYTEKDRLAAQQRAQAMMAEAQALWEASATKARWEAACGGG